MATDKFMFKCATCGQEYQMGPHQYDGKHVSLYQITVCTTCYEGNWDGWAPHYEERLIAHLKDKGLPIPRRNDKGWLPRE
jgi:hypothetical protein